VEDKLISVIVPVYNVDKYLEGCINSILSQTYSHFELLLINDGSFDYSYKICKTYEQKDKRIKVFVQENKGLSAARNLGIVHAQGVYITFVDSDDYVDAKYLENLYYSMIQNNLDLVVSCYYSYEEKTNLLYYYHVEKDSFSLVKNTEALNYVFIDHNFRSIWAKMFRKELFNHIRFPVDKFYEDFFIFSNIIVQAKRIGYLKQNLYCYRIRENSIVHSDFSFKKIMCDIESYEEIIFIYALQNIENSLAVEHYTRQLEFHKHNLKVMGLCDNECYYKLCQRLALLKK